MGGIEGVGDGGQVGFAADKLDAVFRHMLILPDCADGGMRAVKGAKLTVAQRLPAAVVVTAIATRARREQGGFQRFGVLDGNMNSEFVRLFGHGFSLCNNDCELYRRPRCSFYNCGVSLHTSLYLTYPIFIKQGDIMTMKPFKSALFILLALASATAFAHAGHGEETMGFMAGLLHPLTGADHLAAMLAVGVWSAMTTRRIWVAPVSFAALLLVGALMGIAGVSLPAVEPMIAASLLVIGLLLATQAKLPLAACAALVGAFAIFHGAAHGTELASAEPIAAALAGMVLGTALIHIAGLLLGRVLMQRHIVLARLAGGAISIFGVGLLTGVV